MQTCNSPKPFVRWRWLITGQVQGVGFRPFIFRIARRLNLSGYVRNDAGGVVIECQGPSDALQEFQSELDRNHPALASIGQMERRSLPPLSEEHDFHIEPSGPCNQGASPAGTDVTVDTATCQECRKEILSQADRRFGYGLTNCTDCGPRYSIVRRIPYDRCNTTMAHFEMCPECHKEYTDPSDRRFHAQPIACRKCGPTVSLVDHRGDPISGDPIETARRWLLDGRILAIKGLGGFHLAARADDESVVRRLRQLKKRDHKPFALMVRSIEAARKLVDLSDVAMSLMQSPTCPVVLAPRRSGANVATSVAAGNHRLGVMLPYTPIHHLLLAQDLPTLVMTSGNVSDEPLAIDNHDALERLGPMCDAILWHDRPIQRGVDDSVVIDVARGEPLFLRRARGYVPGPISLDISTRQTTGLCLGGELKNTVAVVRNGSAVLSHHRGDLTHPRAFETFTKAIDDLRDLLAVRPQWIAHDLHPMYMSTTCARKLAAELDIPLIGVQHHHAHAASVMAEHGFSGRMLAVVCDGTGYGTDGTIWGGELLACDLTNFQRLARLRPLRLPGGDAAARDTARCGLALLYQAFGSDFADHPAARRLVPDPARLGILCRMIRDDIACATSSGAGRYFDGIAALLGLCDHNQFEAQAAMSLESAAYHCHPPGSADQTAPLFELHGDELRELDLSSLVRDMVARGEQGLPCDQLAELFHEQFARAWASVVIEAAQRTGLRVVGFSGGVFCNLILTQRLSELLDNQGLQILRHRMVPPNDGGLSLGQAAVASAVMVARDGSTETAKSMAKEGVACV